MPQKGNTNVKGHLYVKFTIKFPETGVLSEETLKKIDKVLPVDEKKDADGDVVMEEARAQRKAKMEERRRLRKERGEEEEERYEEDEEVVEEHEIAEDVEGEPNVTPASSKSAYDEDEEDRSGGCRQM